MAEVKNPFLERPAEDKLPPSLRKYACTVVSLLPFELQEEKPHLLPPLHIVPAAPKDGIAVAHIGEATHYVPHPIDERSFKQITSPNELARSICDDYNSAHVAIDENAGPSLFWVEGRLSAEEVIDFYPQKVADARKRVHQWYRNLINMADADWAKNKNVRTVSDVQKVAARVLGVKREWVEYTQDPIETINCPFCRYSIAPDSIKCLNCKEIVNIEKYKELTHG